MNTTVHKLAILRRRRERRTRRLIRTWHRYNARPEATWLTNTRAIQHKHAAWKAWEAHRQQAQTRQAMSGISEAMARASETLGKFLTAIGESFRAVTQQFITNPPTQQDFTLAH